MLLSIIGGTYLEFCHDPYTEGLWGSAMRAACGLSNKGFNIKLSTCIGKGELEIAKNTCETFRIIPSFTLIEETVQWEYYHPLSSPVANSSLALERKNTLTVTDEIILCFGMEESDVQVNGNYVVYDPQNDISFRSTGSSAKHLAIVLNSQQAKLIANINDDDFERIGYAILKQEGAEVVVIKDGPHGGSAITSKETIQFPIFEANNIWPIGSGDIFSAVFAWKWAIEKTTIQDSVYLASQFTAHYCESQIIPLENNSSRKPIPSRKLDKRVYLAGPFFNISERWLINEAREALIKFGNIVFSPYHDVGPISHYSNTNEIENVIAKDLEAIDNSDVVFAILNGADPGTIFEIGYAISKGKEIIILAENINPINMVMFQGTNCFITSDLSTAIYVASL
jgi:nucleoside 2-deoxyribosyltransferase